MPGLLLEQAAARRGRRGLEHLVAELAQDVADVGAHVVVVLDHQDGLSRRALASCRGAGLVGGIGVAARHRAAAGRSSPSCPRRARCRS